VDVTVDLMIHDIDIILSLIPSPVKRIRLLGSPDDREDRRGEGVDGVRKRYGRIPHLEPYLQGKGEKDEGIPEELLH